MSIRRRFQYVANISAQNIQTKNIQTKNILAINNHANTNQYSNLRYGNHRHGKQRSLGFNLIELMVCLLIIAIIFMIAQGSFHQIMLKSHRHQAVQSLYSLAAIEEELLLRTGQYQQSAIAQTSVAQNTRYKFTIDVKTKHVHGYDLFTITADAINAQQQDKACLRFSLDSTNARKAFTSDGTVNMACWQP
ncbi:type IV pilin protein [Thalassotalea litorea]|uniref:type IV pilin protein n=1 Tax=Thalassotalea litorea TaxID=2020715 RepID=UPI00373518AE